MNGHISTGTRNSVKWIDNINNKDILRLSLCDMHATHTRFAHTRIRIRIRTYSFAFGMHFTKDDRFCNIFMLLTFHSHAHYHHLFVLRNRCHCSKFQQFKYIIIHRYHKCTYGVGGSDGDEMPLSALNVISAEMCFTSPIVKWNTSSA